MQVIEGVLLIVGISGPGKTWEDSRRLVPVGGGWVRIVGLLKREQIGCADFQDNAKSTQGGTILWRWRARASLRSILIFLRVQVWQSKFGQRMGENRGVGYMGVPI